MMNFAELRRWGAWGAGAEKEVVLLQLLLAIYVGMLIRCCQALHKRSQGLRTDRHKITFKGSAADERGRWWVVRNMPCVNATSTADVAAGFSGG